MRPKATSGGRTSKPWALGKMERRSSGLEIIHNRAYANEKMNVGTEKREWGASFKVLWRRVHCPLITIMFLLYNKVFHCKCSFFIHLFCALLPVTNCQHNSLPTMKSQCPFGPICHCLSPSPPNPCTQNLLLWVHF